MPVVTADDRSFRLFWHERGTFSHGCLAVWMQTTGTALLALKRCSLMRVRMRAQDRRSAHGLLYLLVAVRRLARASTSVKPGDRRGRLTP